MCHPRADGIEYSFAGRDRQAYVAFASARSRRRANNGNLHRSRDPGGNHVRRNAILRTYPSVVSLRHYVDRRVAHMEFEMDLWVGRQEAIPYRHNPCRRAQMARCVDPQTTHRTQPFVIQILQRTGDLLDCRPKLVEQALASIGR
jgi:hypothetical protein